MCLSTVCTIKGQIIKECATHPDCTKTCNSTINPVPCAHKCIPYGCDCPDGMVVNETNNECVVASTCLGMFLLVTKYANVVLTTFL